MFACWLLLLVYCLGALAACFVGCFGLCGWNYCLVFGVLANCCLCGLVGTDCLLVWL